MRSVRIAAVILLVVVVAVVANAIMLRQVIDGIVREVECAENDGYTEVFEHYKRLESYIILQPEKLRDEAFVEAMRALKPDLGIVIAFRMLPEVIWAMPRLGTFNLHASLLPQYRGAAPINWAIINGEQETGVTTFLLNHEIDKGAIIGQLREPIAADDTIGTLYDRLMHKGTGLVLETVEQLAAGEINPIEQQHIDESTLKPAPKIFKEDCRIDWKNEGEKI